MTEYNPTTGDDPVDPLDELLVAYLDGELPPAEAERVERQLATSEDVRRRLQQLENSAEMLVTYLPRSSPTQEFTKLTVTMAAQVAERELTQELKREQLRRGGWWAGGLAIAVASLGIGYYATWNFLQGPNEQLKRDLPVIQHIDEYRTADSVEFLRRLSDERLFAEEIEDAL
jgi:hypothetical protein